MLGRDLLGRGEPDEIAGHQEEGRVAIGIEHRIGCVGDHVPVAWLVRVARNRAIDRLRAAGTRARAAQAAPADTPAQTSPEDCACMN
ncbi:hypothetical protein HQ576_12980, partial [bacterium]|nr:hypothetical protein [bacterium]